MAPAMVLNRWHLHSINFYSILASGSNTPDVLLHTLSCQHSGPFVPWRFAGHVHKELRLVYFSPFLDGRKQAPWYLFSLFLSANLPLCQSKQLLFNFLHEMKFIYPESVQILFTMALFSTSAWRLWICSSLLMGEIWCARKHPIMPWLHMHMSLNNKIQ